jgi:hypothetical protein
MTQKIGAHPQESQLPFPIFVIAAGDWAKQLVCDGF